MSPLVLSHFSIRNAGFEERVAAASAAGFDAIGLYVGEYSRLRASGRTDAELRDVLGASGQRIHEYEALRGWGSSGPAHDEYLRRMVLVEQMADAFGAPHHVQVVGPYAGSLAEGAVAFGHMCDRLAERGIRAAIEYLPQMSNIPTAQDAWQIVETAGRDNGGLCVDSWHHVRSGETLQALATIPGDRVFGVQFDDGPPEQIDPDYRVDCMSNRQVPGQGSFDLVGFVRTLDGMGVDAAYAIEVISLELDELPVTEAVQRMADGARAVLAHARAA